MTARKPPGGGKRRHLSEEDQSLWSFATRALKPLPRSKDRVHPAREMLAEEQSAGHPKDGSPAAKARHEPGRVLKPEPPPRPKPAPVAKRAEPSAAFDQKAARRLRRGQLEIEARIDLHGMRQSEAHAALRRFLHSAHASGKRWVLIITGKGTTRLSASADEDDLDARPSDRGILKRNVPHWLAEPELNGLIVGWREAAIEHGGAGALYVQLRRRERTGGRR